MRKRYPIFLTGILLMIGGIILLTLSIRSFRTSTIAAPVATSTKAVQAEANAISGNPVRLDLPSLGLSLPVIPGEYNSRTRQWTLSLDKVQYANLTPLPNNKSGNTLIYGHYRKGVFLTLHKIEAGAPAIVTTDNGHVFYYKLTGVEVVKPEESAKVLNYSGKPVLTLQTCTGLFYQNRQLFTFEFQRVV